MDLQKEIKRRILKFLTKNGLPADTDWSRWYYGWIARDWATLVTHLGTCKVDIIHSSYEDAYWYEFQGTFYEGDSTVRGIEAKITCACGEITNRVWRYAGGYVELIKGITEEE